MTLEVKHKFQSAKADGADTSLLRPSNWNDTHEIKMAGQRLLGKPTVNPGDATEISLGAGLEFDAATLKVVLTALMISGALGFSPASDAGDTITGSYTFEMNGPALIFKDTGSGGLDYRLQLIGGVVRIDSTADHVTWNEVVRIDLAAEKMYVNDKEVRVGTIAITEGGTGGVTLAEAKTNLEIGPLRAFGDIFGKWDIVSRSTNVIYQNTTDKWIPIFLGSTGNAQVHMSQSVSFPIPTFNFGNLDSGVFAMIPPGWYYRSPSPGIACLEGRL